MQWILKVPICCHFSSEVNEACFSRSINLKHNRPPKKVVAVGALLRDRGAAALLVVAVAFSRLHDYGACCDEAGGIH